MCRRRRVKMLYVPKCIIIYPAIVVEKKIELTFGFYLAAGWAESNL